ncbi:MAG: septal ring lytic transglycosylase RlpA family protein [Ferruginibacter sp.]
MYRICLTPISLWKPVCLLFIWFCLLSSTTSYSQKKKSSRAKVTSVTNRRVIYGTASFYHSRFDGRQTASGEIFRPRKLTCACNMLPFGTWIRVTNVVNGKSVVVKVNDRLHPNMRRIADLSNAAAQKLGYKASGTIRVKVEVIGPRKPLHV